VPLSRRPSAGFARELEPASFLDPELRTLVTISRTDRRDVGQRQVFVRLDEAPKVALRFGQSFTETVGPGVHRLRAHNTFVWKTVTFAVESGEHLEFVLINRCGPIWQSIAAVLGAAPMFLTVQKKSLV
jgi:hypothetical protein